MNLRPLLAALALYCVIACPAQASNKAIAFYIEQGESGSRFDGLRATDSRKVKKPVRESRKLRKGRSAGDGGRALAIARKYIGTNPTGWKRLWCAVAMNLFEKKAGRSGTGSNLAKSFLKYGKRVSLAQARPGDIVVTGRRGGAHVGYLVQINAKTVTLISGNSGGRGPGRRVVAQGNYAKGRILGIVRPS